MISYYKIDGCVKKDGHRAGNSTGVLIKHRADNHSTIWQKAKEITATRT